MGLVQPTYQLLNEVDSRTRQNISLWSMGLKLKVGLEGQIQYASDSQLLEP